MTGCEDFPDDKDQMTNQPRVATYARNPGGDQPRKEVQGQQMPTSATALARYSTNPGGDQPNKFAKMCKEVQWPVTTLLVETSPAQRFNGNRCPPQPDTPTIPVTVPDNEVSSRASKRRMLTRPDYRQESRPEPTSVRYSTRRLPKDLSGDTKVSVSSSPSLQTHGLSYKMSTPRIPPSCSLVAPVSRLLCIVATFCRTAKDEIYCFPSTRGAGQTTDFRQQF